MPQTAATEPQVALAPTVSVVHSARGRSLGRRAAPKLEAWPVAAAVSAKKVAVHKKKRSAANGAGRSLDLDNNSILQKRNVYKRG